MGIGCGSSLCVARKFDPRRIILADERIECPVHVPIEKEEGDFVNAFRVVSTGEEDWYLDFVEYSSETGAGKVVSRLRVHEEFLSAMKDRLEGTILEISAVRDSRVVIPFEQRTH